MNNDIPYALSLSGGGLSSVAYAGFVEVLKADNLAPSFYVGLSGGAILATLLASELSSEEILQFFDHIKTLRILNTHLSQLEIIDHSKFIALLRNLLPYKSFEQLPTRIGIFVTDLPQKKPLLIQSGDLASAIVASCSVFPLLQPVRRRGFLLGDGGFTVYYGAHYLHQIGIKKVIGIDVTGITEGSVPGIFGALFKQINASVGSNARYEIEESPADMSIQISFPSPTIFNLDRKAHHIINLGRKTAQHYLRPIRRLISS